MTETSTPRWGHLQRDRKAQYLARTLELIFGESFESGCWLDVGCGSGEISKALSGQVRSILGVDPEAWPGWKKLESEAPNLRLSVGQFDQATLPVKANSYEVVVCNQVYEHVGNPRQLIDNIYEALAPGGVCYFAGPNLLWPIEPHVKWPFVHWLPREFAQQFMRTLGSSQAHDLDAFSWASFQLREQFRQAGFHVRSAFRERLVAALESKHPKIASLVRRLPNLVFILFEPVSPGFIYVLQKGNGRHV